MQNVLVTATIMVKSLRMFSVFQAVVLLFLGFSPFGKMTSERNFPFDGKQIAGNTFIIIVIVIVSFF